MQRSLSNCICLKRICHSFFFHTWKLCCLLGQTIKSLDAIECIVFSDGCIVFMNFCYEVVWRIHDVLFSKRRSGCFSKDRSNYLAWYADILQSLQPMQADIIQPLVYLHPLWLLMARFRIAYLKNGRTSIYRKWE